MPHAQLHDVSGYGRNVERAEQVVRDAQCSAAGGTYIGSGSSACLVKRLLTGVTILVDPGVPGDSGKTGFSMTAPHDAVPSFEKVATCPISRSVELLVRSVHDPYVHAARLTQYSLDFGNSPSENVATGFAWLTTGIIMTAGTSICVWCMYKSIQKRKEEGGGRVHDDGGEYETHTTGTYHHQQQPPSHMGGYPQQGGYMQQQYQPNMQMQMGGNPYQQQVCTFSFGWPL